jgi:hypothetical protein
VRLRAEPLELEVRGTLVVRLAANDAAARVTLRALTPLGIRADTSPVAVDVPARGEATALVPLVRAGAPRGSRHEVLLVAETTAEPLARSAVAFTIVRVADDPSLLPRLRVPIFALGGALLALAIGYEAVRALRARSR